MRIVLDTNVLVSALINPNGTPAKVLYLILNEKALLLFDNRIMREYREVLKRKKFKFEEEIIGPLLVFFQTKGEFVAADPIQNKFDDEEDKKFYEIAINGKAKYLVTGNKKHFPKEPFIVSAGEFIQYEF